MVSVGIGYGLGIMYVEMIRVFQAARSDAALVQSIYLGLMVGGGKTTFCLNIISFPHNWNYHLLFTFYNKGSSPISANVPISHLHAISNLDKNEEIQRSSLESIYIGPRLYARWEYGEFDGGKPASPSPSYM